MPRKSPKRDRTDIPVVGLGELTIYDEEYEQIQLFAEMAKYEADYPKLKRVYHPPNGGYRTKATSARLKRMGVRAGTWDVCYDGPDVKGVWCGFRIELKVGYNQLEDSQEDWLPHYQEINYFCAVAYSWRSAWTLIQIYFGIGLE